MAASSSTSSIATKSEAYPVLVLIKNTNCPACVLLSKVWDDAVKDIKKTAPKLRTVTVINGIDPKIYPSDLAIYSKYVPAVLLIPGYIWDEAMKHLGRHNPIKLRDGVQMMNLGKWDKVSRVDRHNYINKYNSSKKQDIVKWFKEAYSNEDFIKVQTNPQPIHVEQPMASIKPMNKLPPVIPLSSAKSNSSTSTGISSTSPAAISASAPTASTSTHTSGNPNKIIQPVFSKLNNNGNFVSLSTISTPPTTPATNDMKDINVDNTNTSIEIDVDVDKATNNDSESAIQAGKANHVKTLNLISRPNRRALHRSFIQ